MKLMIVKDSPQMCQFLRQLLSDLAEVIVECRNGEQAVAACAVERQDWTLMDLRREGRGGMEAPRRFRAAWPEARILIVTEYDDHQHSGRGRQLRVWRERRPGHQ